MVIRSPKLAPNQIHSWINLSMVTRSDFLMCTFLSDPVRSTLTQTFTLMVTQSDSLSLRLLPWWWPSQIHSHSDLQVDGDPVRFTLTHCYPDGDPVRFTLTQAVTLMVTQSDLLSLRLLPWWWPSQIHSHSDLQVDGDPVRSTLTHCYPDGDPVRFTLTQAVTLMVTQSDLLSLRLLPWWWPSQIHSRSLLPWWWPSRIHSHSGCMPTGTRPLWSNVPAEKWFLPLTACWDQRKQLPLSPRSLVHTSHWNTDTMAPHPYNLAAFCTSHSSNQMAVLSVLAKSKVKDD